MTTLRYARATAEDLRSYLEANLNGFIDTISAEEVVSPVLAHPDVYRGGLHPFAVEPFAVEVDVDRMQAESLHNNYWWTECSVHLVFRALDADVIATQQRMRSYSSAVIRCLMADPSLGNKDVDAEITSIEFIPGSQEGQLLGVVTHRITVKRQET